MVGVRDPHRSDAGGDLLGNQVAGQDPPQGGHVRGELGMFGGRGLRGVKLGADIAGEVIGAGEQLAVDWVGEDEVGEAGASLVLVHAEEVGDVLQVDPAVSVKGDREGVGGGVGAQDRRPLGDHPFDQQGCRRSGLGGVVEQFEGLDQRPERVLAQVPHHRRCPAGDAWFTGVRVDLAEHRGVPVDRPVQADVFGPLAVQVGSHAGDLVGVVDAGGLGGQQVAGQVPHGQQVPQFGDLCLGHGEGLVAGRGEDGEGAVVVGVDVALPSAWPGQMRGREGGLGGSGCGGQAGGDRLVGDLGEDVLQFGWQVAQIADDADGFGSVHAVADDKLAQDVVGMVGEVGVEPDDGVVDPARSGQGPAVVTGHAVAFPSAEDEQVGDDLGAGGAAVGPGGQPYGAEQVSQAVHLAAGGGVSPVHGE